MVALSVTMIEPAWRSLWISSGTQKFELEPRDRDMQVEVFAKAAAVASSQGEVQRFCSASRYGSVKIRSPGYLAECMVAGEGSNSFFCVPREPRGRKTGTACAPERW